uniref:Single-stranded DNA-binding protein n=1 Tax=Pseudomonas phage Lepni01 TaxID=3138536 RepID=A0AAU6W378_9VIRU
MAKSTKQFFFTPKGIAEPYCSIQKPDYGNPEKGFGNPRGVYKVNLTVSRADAQPIIDRIVRLHEQNYAAITEQFEKDRPSLTAKLGRGKKLLEPYEGDLPFFENDDGTVTFKFSSYASYQDKETKETKPLTLKVVDAKGKRIDAVPAISGGSELKVRFSMFAYTFGAVVGASVKLQLDSVMLITLKEYASGSDDWADETEEGYVAPEREESWDDHEDQGHAGEVIPDAASDF